MSKSIFSDVDALLEVARERARVAQQVARAHLPEGSEVMFTFGNMKYPAPARVQYVGVYGNHIRVRVRNVDTGGVRNIPLDAIEGVKP